MAVNARWCEMLGYLPQELDLSGYRWFDLVHPEDVSTIHQATADKDLAGSGLFVIEFRMRHIDGRWLWIQSRGKVMKRDAQGQPLRVAGTHQDITERRQVEEELRAASAELELKSHTLRVTLDSISQGISYVDPQQRIVAYNPRYLELLDLPAELLQGQPPVEKVVQFQTERGDFGQQFTWIGPGRARLRGQRVPGARQPAEHARGLPAPHGGRPGDRGQDPQAARRQPGAHLHRRQRLPGHPAPAGQERGALSQPDRAVVRLVLGNRHRIPLHPLLGDLDRTGVLQESRVGRTRWEVGAENMSEGDWAAHRAVLDARQTFTELELKVRSNSGGHSWIALSGMPYYDEQGEFAGYLGIGKNISARKEAEELIKSLAFYDVLTKLPNRRMLLERLGQAAATSQREHLHCALLFIDLDNFKTLNDTQGHDTGDLLLQQVAERLQACVREVDTVARLGGDEFVVMLEGLGRRRHAGRRPRPSWWATRSWKC